MIRKTGISDLWTKSAGVATPRGEVWFAGIQSGKPNASYTIKIIAINGPMPVKVGPQRRGDPMNNEFPAAVPEIPVTDMNKALDYYENKLGFDTDWGGAEGGIAGISKGHCRMFLTDRNFRQHRGNNSPVVIWLNLNNKKEVDELFEIWKAGEARITSAPESKPWKLHEFTASDLDGNLFRVFYDFSNDSQQNQNRVNPDNPVNPVKLL